MGKGQWARGNGRSAIFNRHSNRQSTIVTAIVNLQSEIVNVQPFT
jgi:hypothetical protein